MTRAPWPARSSSTGTVPSDAWKVRVTVNSQHGTRLMRVVGIDSFTSRGGAAASLFAAAPSEAAAPFMVCANPGVVGHPKPILLVDATDSTGFRINPDAIWKPVVNEIYYDIWGNDIKEEGRSCGDSSSSFRGLVDNSSSHPLPGWWPIDTGNKAGNQVELPLIGGCRVDKDTQIKDIPVGCQFLFPLCVAGNEESGSNFELYCVKVGRFEITENGTHGMVAKFLGGGLVTSGAGAGVPKTGDSMILKLSE